jgi:hypothetical protein
MWAVPRMAELAWALLTAGETFHVRRTLQRLEREELTIGQAVELLGGRSGRTFEGGHGSSPTSTHARS